MRSKTFAVRPSIRVFRAVFLRAPRSLLLAVNALLLALAVDAGAQQPKKVYRIGFLGAASAAANAARIEALRQGLRELGYFEGKNILVEYRYADGKRDRVPALAAELVALKVDLIVSADAAATRPARQATGTIPVVMTNDPDPVGDGFVVSLARPGGNITGLSTLTPELTGKRLELLKEIVPKLSRVAVLGVLSNAGNDEALKQTEIAARPLRIQVQYFNTPALADIEAAFREATKLGAEAFLTLNEPVFLLERKRLAALAVKSGLPTVHYREEFV